MEVFPMRTVLLLAAVLLALCFFPLVHSESCLEEARNTSARCEFSQKAMQMTYIQCLANTQFNMTINVEVEDYEIMLSKANEIFDPSEFVDSIESISSQNCLRDVLQPLYNYWSYQCQYNPRRIPQNRWFVECHNKLNPCRNKTVECLCDNTKSPKETSTCSDGVNRTLECSCTPGESSCNNTYAIPQDWKEVYHKVIYLELGGNQPLDTCSKVSPMEVYLSNKWQLKQEKLAVACSCIEREPILYSH